MRLTPSGNANTREVVVAPAAFDVSEELSALEVPVNAFDVVVEPELTEDAAVGTGGAAGAAVGNCATLPANTVGGSGGSSEGRLRSKDSASEARGAECTAEAATGAAAVGAAATGAALVRAAA